MLVAILDIGTSPIDYFDRVNKIVPNQAAVQQSLAHLSIVIIINNNSDKCKYSLVGMHKCTIMFVRKEIILIVFASKLEVIIGLQV